MKKIIIALPMLAVGLPLFSQEKSESARQVVESSEAKSLSWELSDAQADALVQQKFEAMEQRKEERVEQLTSQLNYKVIDRKVVDLGERKIIMNRVSPPEKSVPADGAVEEDAGQPEEIREQFIQSESKEYKFISLSATVYDRKFTELRWRHGDERFLAYSNVDFNFMGGFGSFETDDTNYSFFMGIGNESTDALAERNRFAKERNLEGYVERQIPQMPEFTPGSVEYAVVSDDPSIVERDEVFGQISALHAYYQANEKRLKTEYQRREALNAARKRYEAANPEKPKDTIINFWPIRGSIHQEQGER
ncbi:hypothetical protein ACFSSA_13530 [Luteolibacter algae]|uniref:Uncharacterized protein n=1 Tax=Luteolibacter algae TaxID=454151 RepID=A0ABW5DCP9_9BACT